MEKLTPEEIETIINALILASYSNTISIEIYNEFRALAKKLQYSKNEGLGIESLAAKDYKNAYILVFKIWQTMTDEKSLGYITLWDVLTYLLHRYAEENLLWKA